MIIYQLLKSWPIVRFYGVVVSTLDSDSSDPVSNPGRTFFVLFVVKQLLFLFSFYYHFFTAGFPVLFSINETRSSPTYEDVRYKAAVIAF